jgi:hypothetical protein
MAHPGRQVMSRLAAFAVPDTARGVEGNHCQVSRRQGDPPSFNRRGRSPMATRFHRPLVATMRYVLQPSRFTTGIDSTIGSTAFIPRANQSGEKYGTKQAQSR